MRILTALFLLALSTLPVLAADIPGHNDAVRFIASYTFNLNAAAGLLTLEVPAGSKDVYPIVATMKCSVACSFAQNLNGTVTNGTAVTPVRLSHPDSRWDTVVSVKRDASVAGGSALPTWAVATNADEAFTLEHIAFRRSSSAQSYSISTGVITGTATVSITWAVSRN
jgi:hypothetical protein